MVREVWLVKTERHFFFYTKPNVFAYVRCAHGHSTDAWLSRDSHWGFEPAPPA